ncbi:unnamed protein product [Lactuca virosa]|uniref:Uncharacterized protein n=1 Tax=Lactuca virosa TaxID=75947 RepID=A0AAU9NXP8_9ASTR|nr:unnamed protein product [Lactuca virosa]CAH1442520.1 unnamed protein product [Lactuca virosa]
MRLRNGNIIDSMAVGDKAEASTVGADRFLEIPFTPNQGELDDGGVGKERSKVGKKWKSRISKDEVEEVASGGGATWKTMSAVVKGGGRSY